MKNVANVVMSRLRLKNVSAKAWAEENGFKVDTVYKTIYGIRGRSDRDGESAKIREGLRRDGYWPEEPAEVDEAVNG